MNDGASCNVEGGPGLCSDGQCLPVECEGNERFSICDNPLGGGLVGACVEDACVLAAPEDQCVKVGVGRINCCSQDGCAAASGAYCGDPLNDVSCDPTGLEPPGQAGQDGICENGTCVAQSGLCADVACRTSALDPCARKFCDSDTGACDDWLVTSFQTCATAGGAEGLCHWGTCRAVGNPGACGLPCDDGNSCTKDLCEETSPDVFECTTDTLPDNAPCEGERGRCFSGRCLPLIEPCDNDTDCSDGNPCTVDECEPSTRICRTSSLPDDTLCFEDLGLCRSGVCVRNLCEGRDCSDGDLCTQDNCIPPYGICSNPNEPDGTSCEGGGQCLFGTCQPLLTQCSNDGDCDDGNSCTADECESFGVGDGICSYVTLPNGAPCIGENGQCLLGGCLGFDF